MEALMFLQVLFPRTHDSAFLGLTRMIRPSRSGKFSALPCETLLQLAIWVHGNFQQRSSIHRDVFLWPHSFPSRRYLGMHSDSTDAPLVAAREAAITVVYYDPAMLYILYSSAHDL